MKHLFLLASALTLLTLVGFGQKKAKTRLVRVPKEVGVVATVNQPDCPLRIVQTELLTKEDGAYPIVRYVLQNRSSKPIRYFSVAFAEKFTIGQWHRFGSGSEDGVGRTDGKGPNLLYRGSVYSNWPIEEFEFVPITKRIQELLAAKPGEQRLKFHWIGYGNQNHFRGRFKI